MTKSTQLAVRIPSKQIEELDAAIAAGDAENRSAAIVTALDEWIDRRRRRLVGAATVEEYSRLPQQPSELSWVRAASEASIAAEPW
jgi:Arc/MetJ-type ribon-helix-helix transcriptional regulator